METFEIEFDTTPIGIDDKPNGPTEHNIRLADSKKGADVVVKELHDETKGGSRIQHTNIVVSKVVTTRQSV